MNRNLYSFIFQGLLTEEALDSAGRTSRHALSANLEKDIARRLSIDLLDDGHVENARKMATVYTAIAAFENSVREFVEKVLLDNFKEAWWEKGVSEKIRKLAESRKENENKIKWHTPRGNSPIYYTEFGDLASIMSNNWTLFEDYIQSIEWAREIIRTLEKSRNVIMHSGELSNRDIERVGSYIRDWIAQVGG